jgi:hypothetical protein
VLLQALQVDGYGHNEGEAGASMVPTASTEVPYICLPDISFQPSLRRGTVRVRPGAVVIVHTHPNNAVATPSNGASCSGPNNWDDACTAKKLNGPVYVVHTQDIYKVTPDGKVSQEEGKEWREKHNTHDNGCGCK